MSKDTPMRLTLRTLLAYLDDTLEPAQAKLIGQKIAESPSAQELVNRIKEVVRRRRLTTPPTGGFGDPNTVAEYIDSILPPEQLEGFEKLCLESDVHLAEIAAIHQILTVVLSEPALIPPTARQRMYGLVRGRESIPYRKPGRSPVEGRENGLTDADASDEALLMGLPIYRNRGSWTRRLAPLAVVCLLILFLGLAIWQALPAHSRPAASAAPPSSSSAANASARAAAEPVDNTPNTTTANAATKQAAVRLTEPASTSKASTLQTSAPSPNSGAPAAPTMSGTSAAGAERISKVVPKPPMPDRAPATMQTGQTPPNASSVPGSSAAEVPLAADRRRTIGKYIPSSFPTVLLQRQAGSRAWDRVVRNAPVFSADTFVSLPNYRSEIRLDNDVRVLLWGDMPDSAWPVVMLESQATLHTPVDSDVDLTLHRGRVAISNVKPDGPARVRLRFADQVWDLVLLENGSEIAAEFLGTSDAGFNREAGKEEEPTVTVAVYAMQGQANLRVGGQTHLLREPRGPALFYWTSVTGPAGPLTVSPEQMPPWFRKLPPATKQAQAMRSAADNLAARLDQESAVETVLQEMMQGSDANRSIFAVYCMGAIDDVRDLVDALGNDQPVQVRFAAIGVLRYWLGEGADHARMLFQELESRYKRGPATTLMELLHPYSPRQLRQPETYEALIADLRHRVFAIREIAHLQLIGYAPAGAKIHYDPNSSPQEWEQAYREWKELIPTGKLPPAPNATPSQPATPGKETQRQPPKSR